MVRDGEPTPTKARETISAYDLTISDNTRAVISQPLLNGQNYDEWAQNLRVALSARKKPAFIDGSIPKPASDSLDHEDWKHFVSSITIGAPVIESLRKHTNAYIDCHIVVTNPMDHVEQLGKAGASGFTFHIEAAKDNWEELVEKIKSVGMRPGVAIKPGTPVEEVYPLVEGKTQVEMVLVMTVEPGFGGQKFMPNMMDKVRALRQKYPTLDIQVDGGLGPSTIDTAAAAGANCIVTGSSVFGAQEPGDVISILRASVEKAQSTT